MTPAVPASRSPVVSVWIAFIRYVLCCSSAVAASRSGDQSPKVTGMRTTFWREPSIMDVS